nr:mucin-3B-like isoform X1 [Pelodiscus sinensis]|eukprot:XP_025037857.1 mucin-3B-like isoform X1 [Pelodiscus sinensis]
MVCLSLSGSCQNGGTYNGVECICRPGFVGPTCATSDNSTACQNGSTPIGTKCICPPGHYGNLCQFYNASGDCQNGGTPVGIECICPPAYYGPRCEQSNSTASSTTTRPPTASLVTSSPSTVSSLITSPSATTPHTTTLTTTPRTTTTAPQSTTTTTTPRTTTTTTQSTTKQDHTPECQNGGIWDNGRCKCTSSFQGPRCEFAAEVIEVKAEVDVKVDVKLQVTSHKFTSALANSTTQEYKEFTASFKLQMKVVYLNVQGYKDVVILKLTQGSVVVDHYVLLALPVTEELNTKFAEVTKQVEKKIEEAAQNQNCNSNNNSSICFNASSARVSEGEQPKFNGTEFCQKAAPEGYSQFYFPYLTKSSLSCISNCTKNTPGFLNCNYGQCQLTRAGPQCFCSEMEAYWYPTERCDTRISKLGVGLGLAVAGLVIVSAVLGIFLFRAKQTKTHYSLHSADTDVEKWYENDLSEWSTSGSFCIRNKGADPGKGNAGSIAGLARRVLWARDRGLQRLGQSLQLGRVGAILSGPRSNAPRAPARGEKWPPSQNLGTQEPHVHQPHSPPA